MGSDTFSRWKALIAFAAVFILSLFVLFLNRRSFPTGDSVPYRYLPQAVWEHRTFCLDMFPHLGDPENYAIVRDIHGNLVSKKPVSPALFEIPVFLIFRKVYKPFDIMERIMMGKLAMSLLAALSCAILFTCLLKEAGFAIAFISGLGLVILTPFWFTAMDCWPHPILALMNILSLYLLRKRGTLPLVLIGFFQGIAVTARLGALAVFVVFSVFSFLGDRDDIKKGWRNILRFAAGAALPLILLGLYNHAHFGSPFRSAFQGQSMGRIRWPFEGLSGFLFSPAKGLFLFSPILVFFPVAIFKTWKSGIQARVASMSIVIHFLFWSGYADWWGGWGFGARYLAEILPFIIFVTALFIYHVWSHLKERRGKIIFIILLVILALISFSNQVIGAFTWNGDYHMKFDRGWGEGRFWVWTAPFEPWWRLEYSKMQ
jgi:hypothetical protein